VKALTVRQPWAWALVHGRQTSEWRTWPTKYRGNLLIHAGLGLDPEGYELYPEAFDNLVHGAIIGSVAVVNCIELGHRDYEWVLQDPLVLATPVPCKGKLGIWNAPKDVTVTPSW